MIDISTTATFDRLFAQQPKRIQRKAASKTDLFKFKFLGADHAELRYIGHHHSIYDYDLFR